MPQLWDSWVAVYVAAEFSNQGWFSFFNILHDFLGLKGGFQMAKYANLQNTIIGKVETFDVQSMINKALIGILISKEIITKEEVLVILGNINRQQEIYFEQKNSKS